MNGENKKIEISLEETNLKEIKLSNVLEYNKTYSLEELKEIFKKNYSK